MTSVVLSTDGVTKTYVLPHKKVEVLRGVRFAVGVGENKGILFDVGSSMFDVRCYR